MKDLYSFDFKKYLRNFESRVIYEGVKSGALGKLRLVNVREGKLSRTKFARLMGDSLDFPVPFVIDYYGYSKRSKGFNRFVEDEIKRVGDRQVKSVQTTVVFLASLKIEDLSKITSSQYLKGGFSEFKETILHWRGFEKGKKKILGRQNPKRKDTRTEVQQV